MSTTTVKTLQRAALAAIALVTAAGSAVEAQAATTARGVESYVPADRAATAPGALAATRAGTVRVVELHKGAQNSTATTAQ
jgi:hypothetical protein